MYEVGMLWVGGNEGLQRSPTKNIILLVVTVTGQGDNPTYDFFPPRAVGSQLGLAWFHCLQDIKVADLSP